MLAACGTSSASTGPVTLNFYFYPDGSGATQQSIDNCNKQSGGKYTISYQQLPAAADGQRQQMVRRLAAHDNTMDILGLDVTWEAEFAQAGWVEPWTGANKAAAENGTLKPALDTAMWKGKLVRGAGQQQHAAAVVRLRPGQDPAQDVGPDVRRRGEAEEGRQAALHRDPGRAVRGRHRVVQHHGGQRRRLHPEPGRDQGHPRRARRVKALSIMHQLATGPGADPSLDVQMENQNRLAMEAGQAAFQLNYPFVYPAMKLDNPKLFKTFKWALYPEVIPGMPAKVTIGGTDLAVSRYSQHKALAFQAALCLRDQANQIIGANVGGVPPTLTALYSNPALFKNYPFHADILSALEHASVRPKTPVYQVVSIDISHSVSPASGINPTRTEKSLTNQLNDALQSKGLVP